MVKHVPKTNYHGVHKSIGMYVTIYFQNLKLNEDQPKLFILHISQSCGLQLEVFGEFVSTIS